MFIRVFLLTNKYEQIGPEFETIEDAQNYVDFASESDTFNTKMQIIRKEYLDAMNHSLNEEV